MTATEPLAAWPPADPGTRRRHPGLRLLRLHVASRRIPAALVMIVACGIALRIALLWPWNSYGALQLPLIIEAGCAVAVAATAASPFGDPERATGRWLPVLRLGSALGLTAAAALSLAAAGAGASLTGGNLEMLRNLAGLIGIGLTCAAVLGGTLAWIGPTAYLILGVYGLYTLWHGPALTTPLLWPVHPGRNLAAAACASLVFLIGITLITLRGAQNPHADH